jgi:hypothetical protein
MRRHLTGLDHVVVRVANLDVAADTFRRMGFDLTPRGRHSTGTENHCATLGFDYLELLYVPHGVAPPFYADFPLPGEGMTGLALKSDDAASVRAAWERGGLAPGPLLDLQRPVQRPVDAGAPSRAEPADLRAIPGANEDGRAGIGDAPVARFRLVPLPAERTPGGRVFACEHRTPELVWPPGLRRHPNHVTGINKVVVATTDPEGNGVLWGAVFDVDAYPIPGGISITTGAAPIVLLSPDALARQLPGVALPAGIPAARFAAVYVTTNDLAAAAAVVRGAGFHAVALPDGSFAVPAHEAHGIVLVFR